MKNRLAVARAGESSEMLVKRHIFPITRRIIICNYNCISAILGDTKYNMVAVVENMKSHTRKLLRVYLTCSHHNEDKKVNFVRLQHVKVLQ